MQYDAIYSHFKLLKFVLCNIRDMHKTGTPFVITSAVKESFEMVMLFVSQRWPVLLYGPAGAGKTALISRLAQGHGSQGMSFLILIARITMKFNTLYSQKDNYYLFLIIFKYVPLRRNDEL